MVAKEKGDVAEKLDERACALLLTGRMLCVNACPSSDERRAWVVVSPILAPASHTERPVKDPNLRVATFDVSTVALSLGQEYVQQLFNKRTKTIYTKGDILGSAQAVGDILHSWGYNASKLMQTELDTDFPTWLCSVLLRSSRFADVDAWKESKMTDRAYALLSTGSPVCAEIAASREDLRGWASVVPFTGVQRRARSGVASIRRRKVASNYTFNVFTFEMSAAAIAAGYDVSELNWRAVKVHEPAGVDESLRAVEVLLDSWNVDVSKLISVRLDKDYPL